MCVGVMLCVLVCASHVSLLCNVLLVCDMCMRHMCLRLTLAACNSNTSKWYRCCPPTGALLIGSGPTSESCTGSCTAMSPET